MNTRDIRTSSKHVACDVCGRTLLRGERAETYVGGGNRRSVCELCTTRALNEGWVREGTVPSFEGAGADQDRRRSFLSRLRSRRDTANGAEPPAALEAEPEEPGWPEPPRRREPAREPRHVRAVPTSAEHKVASAVELFNGSEHRRTVAGVGRSLGIPSVSVRPSAARTSVVNVVVSWELCWYRYEVDLSDDQPSVRPAGQGYELAELDGTEREPNAVADSEGGLSFEG
ncbi:MAG: hypothetical protein ACXVQR_05595 [Solirubrobacteraceae bacterium]